MRTHKKLSRRKLISAVLSGAQCDLTIENVRFVNMFTGEIYAAEVDVLDGIVVRVRTDGEEAETRSKTVYDGKGAYLLPGFIDTHMHVESTMMIPENLGRAIVPWGTTTVCTDPHEIGNVMGMDGVKFMLENSKKSALRQYVLAPSCVPSVPGTESTGAEFGAGEIAELLDMPDVIGIAEIMDFGGIFAGSDRMYDIIDEGEKRGMYLQGHAPGLTGKELSAYRLSGAISDHESLSAKEVREKLRTGIHVNLRSSSLIDTVMPDLVKGLEGQAWYDFVSFCTDDVHAKGLLSEGHINRVVSRAIKAGLDPLQAMKMATFNAAREYGFDDLGAIAPGYIADIQLVDELDGRMPDAVFIEGRLVAENGEYIAADDDMVLTAEFENTVRIPQIISAEDLKLKAPDASAETAMVNILTPAFEGSVFMNLLTEELPVTNGVVDISGKPEYAYIASINRYGTGEKVIALIKDFGFISGAYATTISHDSHNMVIVYRNVEDAFIAAENLAKSGGGVCAAENGEILHTLKLPVGGLMSFLPCREVADEIDEMEKAAKRLMGEDATVLKPSLLSLTCMPGYVISNKGIINGFTQEILPVFA